MSHRGKTKTVECNEQKRYHTTLTLKVRYHTTFPLKATKGMRVALWLRVGYWLLALWVFHGKRGDIGEQKT